MFIFRWTLAVVIVVVAATTVIIVIIIIIIIIVVDCDYTVAGVLSSFRAARIR